MTAEAAVATTEETLLAHQGGYHDSVELYAELMESLDSRLARLVERSQSRNRRADEPLWPGLVVTDQEAVGLARSSAKSSSDEDWQGPESPWETVAPRVEAARREGRVFRIERLHQRFGLKSFEVDCVIACLAVELDRRYEKLYAYLNDDVTRKWPSVDLLLKLFSPSEAAGITGRHSLSDHGLLIRARVLSWVDPEGTHTLPQPPLGRCLRLDDGVAGFLLERAFPDPAFERVWDFPNSVREAAALWEAGPLTAEVRRVVDSYFELQAKRPAEPLVCLLTGRAGSGRRYAAEAACAEHGMSLLAASVPRLLAEPDAETLLLRAVRDSALYGAPLFLSEADALLESNPASDRLRHTLTRMVDEQGWLLFAACRRSDQMDRLFRKQRVVEIEAPASTCEKRTHFWMPSRRPAPTLARMS